MEASDCGKMILYVRSIMWDLGIPQLAATVAYEDNDAAIAMANSRKPTSRTRHIDIRQFALCDWVERDLIKLERVPTALNMADHFSKQLGPLLFRRHTDYLLGHVPPKYSPCWAEIKSNLQRQKVPAGSPPVCIPHSLPTQDNLPAAAAKISLPFVHTWLRIIDVCPRVD